MALDMSFCPAPEMNWQGTCAERDTITMKFIDSFERVLEKPRLVGLSVTPFSSHLQLQPPNSVRTSAMFCCFDARKVGLVQDFLMLGARV